MKIRNQKQNAHETYQAQSLRETCYIAFTEKIQTTTKVIYRLSSAAMENSLQAYIPYRCKMITAIFDTFPVTIEKY